ncbi:MAG TPA: hypothetical protein VF507_10200, partial [Pyrinomonadaceae bacterium]
NLPQITFADLKKGEGVMVTGTAGADPSHATAVTVVTGDASVLSRMMRFQQGGGRQDRRPNSPGLPGEVMGGGVGNRDPQPPR